MAVKVLIDNSLNGAPGDAKCACLRSNAAMKRIIFFNLSRTKVIVYKKRDYYFLPRLRSRNKAIYHSRPRNYSARIRNLLFSIKHRRQCCIVCIIARLFGAIRVAITCVRRHAPIYDRG